MLVASQSDWLPHNVSEFLQDNHAVAKEQMII